ncbi:MAG TPA: hypothetical protein VF889_00955, partial [Bacteroidota bacterium]
GADDHGAGRAVRAALGLLLDDFLEIHPVSPDVPRDRFIFTPPGDAAEAAPTGATFISEPEPVILHFS